VITAPAQIQSAELDREVAGPVLRNDLKKLCFFREITQVVSRIELVFGSPKIGTKMTLNGQPRKVV